VYRGKTKRNSENKNKHIGKKRRCGFSSAKKAETYNFKQFTARNIRYTYSRSASDGLDMPT